jgi:poly(ADP-ribose) glycohydrolase
MNDYSFAYWVSNPDLGFKLKFLFRYFYIELEYPMFRNFTIYKENLSPIPKNMQTFCKGIPNYKKKKMTTLTIEDSKKIEDFDDSSTIMTDFANEFIGGGAANFGNV